MRPDSAAQQEGRRPVRSGRHDHGVRGQPPAVRDDPDRPPAGDLDAVDECLGGNRQVRPRPCLVEIRERGVPANRSHGVDGRRSDADGRVEVVEIRESRQSDARTGLEQRAMERRQLVRAIRPRADRGFGPAQVRLELGERPAVAPLVVVVTRAPHDEARVVSRATAEDPRARGRPVVGLVLPEVRHRQGASVEHVRGPASFRVAAVVRPGLDEADRALRLLAQPCGEHAARRPSTHDDHVEALGHPATLFGAAARSGSRFSSQRATATEGTAREAPSLPHCADDQCQPVMSRIGAVSARVVLDADVEVLSRSGRRTRRSTPRRGR